MDRLDKIVTVLALFISYNGAKGLGDIEKLDSTPNYCTYEYAYEMYGAHCAGRMFSKVPSLRTSIEILDFSANRLQELESDTFSSYTNIIYLYLAYNQIYSIQEDALTSLTRLETLDLSNNVILELPNSLFQLPSLRKLNLKGNPSLHKKIHALSIQKPIKAPLERLDLANCKLGELPDLGTIPSLSYYNISHNALTKINSEHFAGMCDLSEVDLTGSIDKLKLCDLRSTVIWFYSKHVTFKLADYARLNTREFESCQVANEELASNNATYHRCKSMYVEVRNVKVSKPTWLKIVGGLVGFLVGFILLLYIIHRHNVRQTKTTAEKLQQQKAARGTGKDGSAVLLNDIA